MHGVYKNPLAFGLVIFLHSKPRGAFIGQNVTAMCVGYTAFHLQYNGNSRIPNSSVERVWAYTKPRYDIAISKFINIF